MSNLLETTIPFSGFYESYHSHNLDHALEQLCCDDSGDAETLYDDDGEEFELWEHYDSSIAHTGYARLYLEKFADLFEGECGINLNVDFDELTSPREYNFQTDRIFAKIPVSVARELYRVADKDKLRKAIARKFTSRDGFMSYYSNSLEAWRKETGDVSKWDANQVGTLLESVFMEHASDEWEVWIMEDADSNGELSDLVWDSLDTDAVRILNARDEVRRKRQWFLDHQMTLPFHAQ